MPTSDAVTAAFEASHRRDLEATLDCFTDDGIWDVVPLTSAQGREGIRALMAPMFDLMTGIEVIVHRQIEVGDVVMHERLDRFEVNGTWHEIPVAGVFEVREGKLALWRDFFDLKAFERQIAQS